MDKYKEIAIKYLVEDLPGALLPGTPITNVLKRLESGEQSISIIAQNYLIRKKLLALHRYIKNEITFNDFLKAAKKEQNDRRKLAEIKILQLQKEQQLQNEAQKQKDESVQARLRKISRVRENQSQLRELKQQYGLDYFIEKDIYPKIMNILSRVDKGTRLPEVDFLWLNTEGEEYFTQELREGYHRIEADFYANIFRKSKDIWAAVNASSHYRKGREPQNANSLLNQVDLSNLNDVKLKSAVYTTHGGTKRDLQNWKEALSYGEQAHNLTPKDFRPCTLLGAVNMEIGNLSVGQSWYEKAVERGFSKDSMDHEIRVIFMRAPNAQKKALRVHLFKIDPYRYRWVNKHFKKTQK